MGDADIAQDMGPTNDELETILDEALGEVDNEISRLISLLNSLNARMTNVRAKAMSLMSSWQKFRLCFTALNLFIIPIILSNGIVYETVGWITRGSMLQTAVETFIMIAMCFSLSLGLPFYVYTLWVFFANDEVEDILLRSAKRTNSALDVTDEPPLERIDESLDAITMFRAFSRARVLADNYYRMDVGIEDDQVREDSEESEGFGTTSEEIPATSNSETIKLSKPLIIDLDSDDSLTDADSDTSRSEPEYKLLKPSKTSSRSILRTINIMSEKENSKVTFAKDIETYPVEQPFGM